MGNYKSESREGVKREIQETLKGDHKISKRRERNKKEEREREYRRQDREGRVDKSSNTD